MLQMYRRTIHAKIRLPWLIPRLSTGDVSYTLAPPLTWAFLIRCTPHLRCVAHERRMLPLLPDLTTTNANDGPLLVIYYDAALPHLTLTPTDVSQATLEGRRSRAAHGRTVRSRAVESQSASRCPIFLTSPSSKDSPSLPNLDDTG
ncbi:hypothetical protein FB45DRAFT_1039849 [Roridomyces roridus]|uniref:Uncharacterized protein n=1 Tax=Roridomyces roridus TaxID=1738132 RepID=A0AAD7FB01_9AGAR|nr:hypothetical protein FB45DRAFT_1039849 [Roridomyces roridus]